MKGEGQAEELYNYYLKRFEKILGNKATSSSELTSLGKKLFGEKYAGTFAKDQIKSDTLNNKYSYAIINNQNSFEDGEHWVCVAYKNGVVYAYDSYGQDILNYVPSLRKYGKIVNADGDAEQYGNQANCGARCISYLYIFDRYGKDIALKI
jgi:hypothetical protein